MVTRMTRLIDAHARGKITSAQLAEKLQSGLTLKSKIPIEYEE